MAPFVGKHNAGGIGDYQWPEDDSVIEVDPYFAAEILQLAPFDFFLVDAPEDNETETEEKPRKLTAAQKRAAEKAEAEAAAAAEASANDDDGDDSEKGDAEEE